MEKEKSRPNFVFIIADQLRGDSLGCAGHPDVRTPAIDALAADGVMFDKAYSTNPICVPTRASLISGNYSHKCTGRKNNGGALRDDQYRLPKLFSDAGYRTHAVGKLHYLPYAAPGEERTTNGFQSWRSAESGRVLKQYDREGRLRGVEDYFDYLSDVGWHGFTRAHGVGNNDIHPAVNPLPEAHQVDAWVAGEAVQFLDSAGRGAKAASADGGRPFFLHVGFPKPHSPFDPPARLAAAYDPRCIQRPAINRDGAARTPSSLESAFEHGQGYLSPEAIQVMRAYYYGLISFQDEQVARVFEALKRNGLWENTVVVFTADHGEMLGDFGFHFKSAMYEGSARVPLIVRVPTTVTRGSSHRALFKGGGKNGRGVAGGSGRAAASGGGGQDGHAASDGGRFPQQSSMLVGLPDLMPTMCDYAGITLDREVDGISLAPEIDARAAGAAAGAEAPGNAQGGGATNSDSRRSAGRETLVSYSLDSPRQTAMITDGRFKYIYNEAGAVEELYDLADDPAEEWNLAADKQYQGRRAELKRELISWARENGDEQLLDGDTLREAPPLSPEQLSFNVNRMGWRWY